MNLNITVFDGINLYDNFGSGNRFVVWDEAWVNGALYDFVALQERFNAEIIYFLIVNDNISITENINPSIQSQVSVKELIYASDSVGIMLLSYIIKHEDLSVIDYLDNLIVSSIPIPVIIEILPRARIFTSSMKMRVFDVNSRYRVFTANIQKTVEKK